MHSIQADSTQDSGSDWESASLVSVDFLSDYYDASNSSVASTEDRVNTFSRGQYISIAKFDSFHDTNIAAASLNDFFYTYDTRHISARKTAKIYQCRSHVDCQHRIKIVEHKTLKNFELKQFGNHESEIIVRVPRGISLVVKDEIERPFFAFGCWLSSKHDPTQVLDWS